MNLAIITKECEALYPKVRSSYLSHPKSEPKIPLLSGVSLKIIPWLELVNLFHTFEDLELVKDKQADTQAVRQLLNESNPIDQDLSAIL